MPGGGFGVGPGLLDLRERNGAGVDVDGGDSLGQGAKLGDVLAGADRALAAADDLQPDLAQRGPGHLLKVIRHSLRKIQYQSGLIEGCLAGTGLSLEPDESDIMN